MSNQDELISKQLAHVRSIIADMQHYRRPAPVDFIVDMNARTGVPKADIEQILTDAGYEPVPQPDEDGYRLPPLTPAANVWYEVRPIEFLTRATVGIFFVTTNPNPDSLFVPQLIWRSVHYSPSGLAFFKNWFDGTGPDSDNNYRILIGSPHRPDREEDNIRARRKPLPKKPTSSSRRK